MISNRLANEADLEALRSLIAIAADLNQRAFLPAAELAASHAVMGLDTQLITDRTYFIIEDEGELVGCGGWSFRTTTHGGDLSHAVRDATSLDPTRDAARIRGMYTHPDHVRRGVGRRILELSEAAARDAGFAKAMMVATLSGEPLYRAAGYEEVERINSDPVGEVRVPLVVMQKLLR